MTTTDPTALQDEDPLTQPGSLDALDLEIKDAQLIFDSVWAEIEAEVGVGGMRFPKECFWLNGAPGAGKGTQTKFIMEFRDITTPPVLVSSLLRSPEARRLIDAGRMVGDREVTSLVFRRLVDPVFRSAAVIDGYPRTKVQVLCVKLLYERLMDLRRASLSRPPEEHFPKPSYHIIVLFVDEAESVQRQLKRGRGIRNHNEQVRKSGMGEIVELRTTDLSEEAARNRYRTFKEITYESLKTLRKVFHYHYINAHGSVADVQERIVSELRYQSSLELDEATYDIVAQVPIASQLVIHSRQELVRRLDSYARLENERFQQVVELIRSKFIPIIERHAMSGMTYINSEDAVFEDPRALAMLIDIFTERGFHAAVDLRHYPVPDRVDRETFKVITRDQKVYRFKIKFAGGDIRRGR